MSNRAAASGFRKLSILIAAYNEAPYVYEMLMRIAAVELRNGMRKEVILVDDGSTDGTWDEICNFGRQDWGLDFVPFRSLTNRGKGACVQMALARATGELVVVQDADLEYDCSDYNAMLDEFFVNQADVVYGSRFLRGGGEGWTKHRLANWCLTRFSNWLTGFALTDVHTCYKMFKREILEKIHLEERRFGFCAEVTAKMARIPELRVVEVPIRYQPRGVDAGKKIRVWDAFGALCCGLRYSQFPKEMPVRECMRSASVLAQRPR